MIINPFKIYKIDYDKEIEKTKRTKNINNKLNEALDINNNDNSYNKFNYDFKNRVLDNKKEIGKELNKIDILDIQKYIINNHIELLKNDLKEELIKIIKQRLYDFYLLKNEIKIDGIIKKILDKMFGYDILQKYIEMINVTDIRAVKFDEIYIKKFGKWIKVEEKFESKEYFEEYIRYCVLKNNSNINFDSPIVIVSDKKYRLRIEVGISPVNSINSSIVIRIHRHNKDISLESLFIKDNMLEANSYSYMLDVIKKEKNIVISGKGGSGKTSFLKAILDKIPEEKSITINEETTELYLENRNVIQREVLDSREESKKITLEKLMKHSLVMSNEILVIGELKGSETSFFVDAISTGHIGFATVHSDSAKNTINRLITLFKRDIRTQQYKEEFVKQILASSIDVIVFIENYKILEIEEIDYDLKNNEIIYKKVY